MQQTLLFADSDDNLININYIKSSVSDTVVKLGGEVGFESSRSRPSLYLTMDEISLKFLQPSLEDKVADTIAVNYKYNYFKDKLRVKGLDELEFELLLCALISADIDEDKRYIRSKIRKFSTFAIDGIFNFTLKALQEKWKEVVTYIPTYFSLEELKEFVNYLVKEKTNRKVYATNSSVYDRHFNKLCRVKLIPYDKANIIREILLASASEVELISDIPTEEEVYLKEFFVGRISFSKNRYP